MYISGVVGGDGSALVLDVKANGMQDIGQNLNDNDLGLIIVETADTKFPRLYNATLDLNNGELNRNIIS